MLGKFNRREMLNKRLLTEKETTEAVNNEFDAWDSIKIAQDLKTFSLLIEWLNEPCTEHDLYLFHCEQKSKYDHRKDCPLCWESLKSSSGLSNLMGKFLDL